MSNIECQGTLETELSPKSKIYLLCLNEIKNKIVPANTCQFQSPAMQKCVYVIRSYNLFKIQFSHFLFIILDSDHQSD